MSESLGSAVLELSTDGRKLDRGIAAAKRQRDGYLSGSAKAMAGAGAAMTAGLTVPITAMGVASFKAFGTFDQTIRQVGSVADISGGKLEAMRGVALQLGADTSFSANQAAEAMLELSKGGMTATQIKAGALSQTLTLAAAGGLELGNAATYMANTLNTFGLGANKAKDVAAALAGGANASTASVESLGMGLSQVGAQAKTSGMGLNETVAALALFDQAGVKGSDAGTSLKTMLQNLSPQTDDAAAKMKELGISFKDAKGNFLPMSGVAQELKTGLAGLNSESERSDALITMFGTDASRAAAILGSAGAKGINKYAAATRDLGAAERLAKTNTEGAKGSIEAMKGSLETAGILIGGILAPIVTRAAQGIAQLANKFSGMGKSTQLVMVVLAALVAAVGPVLMMAGALAAAVMAISMVGLPVIATIAAIVAAIVGLGIAFTLAWQKSAAFRKFVTDNFTKLKAGAMQVLAGLRATITQWVAWGTAIWRRYGDEIMAVVGPAFQIILTVISTVLGNIKSVVSAALALLRGDWRGAWDEVKAIVTRTLGAVKSIAKNGVKLVGAQLALLKKVVSDLGGKLMDGAKSVGKAIVDGIVAGIKAGAGAIKDAATSAAKGALDGAKDFLRIRSPSQVMAKEVGMPIAQGVAMGIDWGSEEAADRVDAMGAKIIARGQAMAKKAEKTKGKGDDKKAAKVIARGNRLQARAERMRAQAAKRQTAIDRIGAVAGLGQAFVDLRIARQGGPSVADLQEKMAIGDRERLSLEAQLKKVDKKGKSTLTVEQRTAIMQRLGQIAGDAAALTDQIADLQSPLHALAQASSQFGLEAARAEYDLAMSGGKSVPALQALVNVAEQQKAAIISTLNQPGLSVDEQTSLWQQLTQLVGSIGQYQEQIAELTNPGSTSGADANVAGSTAGAVTRLPGQVASDAGGSPVIGEMHVTVTDPDVDVPQLTRRINWHARQVGAY